MSNKNSKRVVKRVILRASDIASIVGMNEYKPMTETLKEYWKRYSPDTFNGQTEREKVEAVICSSDSVGDILKTALSNETTDVQTVVEETCKKINIDTSLSDSQKLDVIKHVTSKINTNHGTKSESKTAQKITDVKKDTQLIQDSTFYTTDVMTIDRTDFVICGTIDRIQIESDGRRTLIEIKNRVKRLFNKVVNYEFIQIQTYLQLLGLEHARLVEQYKDEIDTHDIERDDDFWDNDILPKIKEFCIELKSKM